MVFFANNKPSELTLCVSVYSNVVRDIKIHIPPHFKNHIFYLISPSILAQILINIFPSQIFAYQRLCIPFIFTIFYSYIYLFPIMLYFSTHKFFSSPNVIFRFFVIPLPPLSHEPYCTQVIKCTIQTPECCLHSFLIIDYSNRLGGHPVPLNNRTSAKPSSLDWDPAIHKRSDNWKFPPPQQ